MLKGSSTELEERRKEEFHILRCSQHIPSQKLLEWEENKVDFQASEHRRTSIRDDGSWHPEAHVGRSSCLDSCWTFPGLMNHIKDRSEGGTRIGRTRLGHLQQFNLKAFPQSMKKS
eukprot:XP_011673215.1 PREDICTED: uncharacterized protein LOC105442620 isoform X2 [Strongylocentrotus purpuratus]